MYHVRLALLKSIYKTSLTLTLHAELLMLKNLLERLASLMSLTASTTSSGV